ncbi:hypothetical protein ACROYT_G034126 [Oculina patagonica]
MVVPMDCPKISQRPTVRTSSSKCLQFNQVSTGLIQTVVPMGENAITPRPTWTASGANTRVSTTVPLSETHYEAMNFVLLRTIGKEILIKSNINNWIACKEGTGSIVQLKAGSITCKLVKQVSKQCAGVVPKSLALNCNGPIISASSANYYFDGNTDENWPTHDPCGKTSQIS